MTTDSAGQGPAIPIGAWPAALLTGLVLTASFPWAALLATLLWGREAAAVALIPAGVGMVVQWGCGSTFRQLYREHSATWWGRRQVLHFMYSRPVLIEAAKAIGLPAPAAFGTAAAVGKFVLPVVGMLLFAWLGAPAWG